MSNSFQFCFLFHRNFSHSGIENGAAMVFSSLVNLKSFLLFLPFVVFIPFIFMLFLEFRSNYLTEFPEDLFFGLSRLVSFYAVSFYLFFLLTWNHSLLSSLSFKSLIHLPSETFYNLFTLHSHTHVSHRCSLFLHIKIHHLLHSQLHPCC